MAISFLPFTLPAYSKEANFSTGNGFLEYCEYERPECNNYIAGMVDGFYSAQAEAKIDLALNCGPTNMTIRQIKDIFVKFLKENPEIRSNHTGFLFIKSMRKTFPCQ